MKTPPPSDPRPAGARGLSQAGLLGLIFFVSALLASSAQPARGDVNATFNAATDIPIMASSYDAAGQALNVTLNFTPSAGTSLTVIRNTGTSFIAGTFSNAANGATVTLTYNGTVYPFVAWYYGGAGRDLVLFWPSTNLAAWGAGVGGELGNNDPTEADQRAPVAVDQTGALAGKTVVQVACGGGHTLALTSDGSVYAWGSNLYGQLGNNDSTGTRQYAPTAVNMENGVSALFGKAVVAIAAGGSHSLALCSDGTVAAWGRNAEGELGNNDSTGANQFAPAAVNAASGLSALYGQTVVAIAAGNVHSLALCADGTIAAWGYNGEGQLGNDDFTAVEQYAPVAVSSANGTSALFGKTALAVAAGSAHSLALCSDGTVAAWGWNVDGELGNSDSTGANQYAPAAVNTANGVSALFGKTVTAIAAGGEHTLALCSDGTVTAWGRDSDGELGNNDRLGLGQFAFAPVAVDVASGSSALFGKTVVAIAAGSEQGLALCSDGTVAAWGDNAYGELGNNDRAGADQYVPVSVSRTGASVLAGATVTGLAVGSEAGDSVVIYAMPTIQIEQTVGVPLASGSSTVAFGTKPLHRSEEVTFTVRNTGFSEITGLSAAVTGVNAAEYTVGAFGATSLAQGASTTFAVTFTPSGYAGRVAELHVQGNALALPPFNLNLTGVGAIPPTVSRIQFYPHIGGSYAVSETDVVTTTVSADGFSDSQTQTVPGSGTITITQDGNRFSYEGMSNGLEALRTGVVTGNTVTISGVLTNAVPGVIITENQYNAVGVITDGKILVTGTGIAVGHEGSAYETVTTTDTAAFVGHIEPESELPIAVEVSPARGGKVKGTGAYLSGASVTLTAEPNPGYYLVSWTENGASVGVAPIYPITAADSGTLIASFAPVGSGNYAGLIQSGTTPTDAGLGYFRATLSATGVFSAKLTITDGAYVVAGFFDANWNIVRTYKRPGQSDLVIKYSLDPATRQLIVNAMSASPAFSATSIATPAPLFPKSNPTPFAGRFTMLLPADPATDAAAEPQGDGCLTIAVSPLGTVVAGGKLADGTTFTASGLLGSSDLFTLYTILYPGGSIGHGSLSANLAFHGTGVASDTADGTVYWFKDPIANAKPGTLYPGGVTTQLQAVGQRYIPPPQGSALSPSLTWPAMQRSR